MNGFYSVSELPIIETQSLIPKCGACGLYKSCKSPKMVPRGKGKKNILIVGDAPNVNDDKAGRPFASDSGDRLRKVLAKCNIDMERDCIVTNSLICRPQNKIDQEIGYCRPNLLKTIASVEPETIILLGEAAVASLIGHLWREDVGSIATWIGWQIPSQTLNAWICPTWHPSYLGYANNPVVEMYWQRHIREALSLEGAPWKTVPDYTKQVELIYDDAAAVSWIERFMKSKRSVAFDYETDRLKPDNPESEIICCSLSDGVSTMSFPWRGKAVKAMKAFLKSDVPKIASNMKFEDRWTRAILGISVRNWDTDTMLLAHTLDNRHMITSIKFQSFVRLGMHAYDDPVRKYLGAKDKGANTPNRIKECPLQDLLLYNALDSLLEWKVAKLQRKELR